MMLGPWHHTINIATKGDISVIYMDNAATTMHKPKTVIDAVVAAMSSMGNAGRGANEASLSASRIIYDTRERLAKLFGAENPKQIVFTMNSTESLNIAIKGLIEPGDHVITTMLEHNSVLRPLYEMEERGATSRGIFPWKIWKLRSRQRQKL